MSDSPQALRDLHNATVAATALLAAFAESIGEDAEAIQITVESETDFSDAAERVLYRLGEIKTLMLAIDQQVELIQARKSRLALQQVRLRTALASAIEHLGLKRFETASATLTIKALPRKAKIVDFSLLPPRYWRTPPPKPDLSLISAEVKSGVSIPGVELDNGGQTLQITYS